MRGSAWFAIGTAGLAACSSFGVTSTASSDAGAPNVEAGASADASVGDGDTSLHPVGSNLTPTGDFEDLGSGANCGSTWIPYQGTEERVVGGHDSTYFCQICRASGDYFSFDESPFATAVAGTWYRVTAWVRGGDAAPTTLAFVGRTFNDLADAEGQQESASAQIPLTDDGAWHEVTYDFQVPLTFQEGATVDAYLDLTGFGGLATSCLDVDDFSVFELQ